MYMNAKQLENIEIVCRQTDYDYETALRELNNNDNNVEKVIKKYLETENEERLGWCQ